MTLAKKTQPGVLAYPLKSNYSFHDDMKLQLERAADTNSIPSNEPRLQFHVHIKLRSKTHHD